MSGRLAGVMPESLGLGQAPRVPCDGAVYCQCPEEPGPPTSVLSSWWWGGLRLVCGKSTWRCARVPGGGTVYGQRPGKISLRLYQSRSESVVGQLTSGGWLADRTRIAGSDPVAIGDHSQAARGRRQGQGWSRSSWKRGRDRDKKVVIIFALHRWKARKLC